MKKMKIVFLTALLAILASTAYSFTIGLEYETYLGDPVYTGTEADLFTPGTDFGFFIWTDDESRHDWHIRWSGDGPDTIFSGLVGISSNVADFASVSFDNHGISDYMTVYAPDGSTTDIQHVDSTVEGVSVDYKAIANVGFDGIDISIIGDLPGYIAFDLFIAGSPADASSIFIGDTSLAQHPLDQDFKIAAPVPEPGTLLLLGSGLVGLAFLKRRKS